MTPVHIVIGAAIILIGVLVSLGRWAHISPRFRGWFTRRFPKVARVLITPDDEEQPWLR